MPTGVAASTALGQTDRSPVTLQSAAGANGNGTSLALTAKSQQVILTVTGAATPVMSVIPEHSLDGGSTWITAAVRDVGATAATLLVTIAAAVTPAYVIYMVPPGATHLRARVSGFVSGTVTVTAVERRM